MEAQLDIIQSRVNGHRDDLLREADNERLARQAGAIRGWYDPALWAALVGPVVGLGFLTYFAQEIMRAVGRA